MNKTLYLDLNARKILLDANGIVAKTDETRPINDLEALTAKAFIESCCKKLKQKNTRNSSYGLKHRAENWGRQMNEVMGEQIFSEYVSNGAFIKAASELGFIIYRIDQSLNCHFQMSLKR